MIMWLFLIINIIGMKFCIIMLFINEKYEVLWAVGIVVTFILAIAISVELIPEITKIVEGIYIPFVK